MKKRQHARGRTGSRDGSMQTNVYTNRKERVWVGCRQVNRWMSWFWKTKATPMRELKRRKFDDMVGMLKLGRST
jgi:hypothetical protein